jgi:hypothetical protein
MVIKFVTKNGVRVGVATVDGALTERRLKLTARRL